MKLQKPQKQNNLVFWIIVIIFIISFLAVPGFKILWDSLSFLLFIN